MGALLITQSSNQKLKMKSLLVCMSVVAVACAEEAAKPAAVLPALPLGYGLGHLGYGYGAYPYAHAIAAPVAQVEIEVKSFQPELVETGCKNSFGNPVPCFIAGE